MKTHTIERNILCNVSCSEDLTNQATYLILNTDEQSLSLEAFRLKQANRNVKTLLHIDSGQLSSTSLKALILKATDCGVDGFIIKNPVTDDVHTIKRLQSLLLRLPSPYDFKWDLFVVAGDPVDISVIKNIVDVIDGIIVQRKEVKHLTDNHIDKSQVIVFADNIAIADFVKYNKLAGVMITNTIMVDTFHAELQNTLQNKTNAIDYPTSKLLKQEKIQQEEIVSDIIESYSYSEPTVQHDKNSSKNNEHSSSENMYTFTVSLDIDLIK